jgi:hypothetical protein
MDEDMDEDIGSSETDSEASGDRIQTPGRIHASGRDVDLDALGGPVEETFDEHSRSPTPPTDYNDNDHGPVESGPLMNEVCSIGRKGQRTNSMSDSSLFNSNVVHSVCR